MGGGEGVEADFSDGEVFLAELRLKAFDDLARVGRPLEGRRGRDNIFRKIFFLSFSCVIREIFLLQVHFVILKKHCKPFLGTLRGKGGQR